jgi:hypothetical protein
MNSRVSARNWRPVISTYVAFFVRKRLLFCCCTFSGLKWTGPRQLADQAMLICRAWKAPRFVIGFCLTNVAPGIIVHRNNCCTAPRRTRMNPTFENTMSRIADKARGRYARLVKGARQRTESAADRVALGKKPVKTITGLGLKLTAISHKTADQVLRQQTRLVEHQIDAVADRLKAAADARNLGELVRTQLRLIPHNVSRIAGDARDTLNIVANAGLEVRDVVKSTISELRGKTPSVKKARSKKASTRKASPRNAKRKVKAKSKAAGKTKAA